MKLHKLGIISWCLFSVLLISAAVLNWSCSNPTPSSSTPVASIVVTNNSSYAVTMGMDGGTAVLIAVGGSNTFTTGSAGSHTFSATSPQDQYVCGNTGTVCAQSCPGTTASHSSSSLSLNQQYTINVADTLVTPGCHSYPTSPSQYCIGWNAP
jgi:hypothetical protein